MKNEYLRLRHPELYDKLVKVVDEMVNVVDQDEYISDYFLYSATAGLKISVKHFGIYMRGVMYENVERD